jgi:16S rRNA (guanine527-N7)-methyltransferase
MDKKILRNGTLQLGINLSPKQLKMFMVVMNNLKKWNDKINLTTITSNQSIIVKHFLDSLSIHTYINKQTIADVGTGAGFPSLPLAIIYPQKHFFLIEKNNKKIVYLKYIKNLLNLSNVHIIKKRVEKITKYRFQMCISRAFSSLCDIYVLSENPCFSKSLFLAMKGVNFQNDMINLSKICDNSEVFELNVPYLEQKRYLIRFHK